MASSNWVLKKSLIKELFAKVWAQCEETTGMVPGARTAWGRTVAWSPGEGRGGSGTEPQQWEGPLGRQLGITYQQKAKGTNAPASLSPHPPTACC